MSDDLLWAHELKGRWVMHAPTHTIDKVCTVHEPGQYISKVNNRPVQAAVIELDDGASFMAAEDNFVPLTENEAGFYVYAQFELSKLLSEMVKSSALDRIPPATVGVLLTAALRAQLAALHPRLPADERAPNE